MLWKFLTSEASYNQFFSPLCLSFCLNQWHKIRDYSRFVLFKCSLFCFKVNPFLPVNLYLILLSIIIGNCSYYSVGKLYNFTSLYSSNRCHEHFISGKSKFHILITTCLNSYRQIVDVCNSANNSIDSTMILRFLNR